MFKKISFAVILMGFSYAAIANWVGGINYHHIVDEANGIKINLSAISGSLGHKILMQDNIYMIPTIRVGVGVKDDTVTLMSVDVDAEIDGFFGVSLKGQMEVNNNVYMFVAPSYANFNVTASAVGNGQQVSATEDTWNFGIGAGAGYRFGESHSAELSYERFDGVDVWSAGLKFDF